MSGSLKQLLIRLKEIKSTIGIKGVVKTEVTGKRFRGVA